MHYKHKNLNQLKRRTMTFFCIIAICFMVLVQGCQHTENSQSGSQAEATVSTQLLSQRSEFYQPTSLRTELMMGAHVNNIRDAAPEFSWNIKTINDSTLVSVNDHASSANQTAYQIEFWQQNHDIKKSLLWNSGRVKSTKSVALSYQGPVLLANNTYQWRVKVWLETGAGELIESAWSQPQMITLASTLDNGTSRFDLMASEVEPASIKKLPSGRYLIDFGQSAFGYLALSLTSDKAGEITVYFGERGSVQGVVTKAELHKKSSVRYYKVPLNVHAKSDVYRVNPPRDKRNTKSGKAITIPGRFGRIAPFRYIEVDAGDLKLSNISAQQIVVHYPFDDYASSFNSSDETLNAVWNLSKYSMKATSFAGVYVDGDRERIPYEADAYINQLSHYLVDSEYTLARYSHEYLLEHPTWPTEWKQHSIMMAWMDWMYTGDLESLGHHFDMLKKEKTLEQYARADGLIVSFPDQKVRPPKNRDIVDWPPSERDNFEFKPVNAVINAFHYLNLTQMADMANAIGKNKEYQFYKARAEQVYKSFNKVFYQEDLGIYVDGEGSNHASFHSNVAALAFGLVPDEKQREVVTLIKGKGMAGSVYFAQYLLEALYLAGESEYALSMMTAKTKRSWFNMIRVGSTITLEAWDDVFKPNQDWNHAWGAVPGNIVGRFILGVKPLSPGFDKIEIAPQLASLEFARGKVPTIKGPVIVSAEQVVGQSLLLKLTIPNNTSASVVLPTSQGKNIRSVRVNGKLMIFDDKTGVLGGGVLASGQYTISVRY